MTAEMFKGLINHFRITEWVSYPILAARQAKFGG